MGRVLGGPLGPVPHLPSPPQPPAAGALQGRLDLPAETQGKVHVSPCLLPSARHLPEGRASQTQVSSTSHSLNKYFIYFLCARN